MPDLDLLTSVGLAAPVVGARIVDQLAERGFPGVKVSHGYVVQRLLVAEPTITELAEALGITQQGASKQVADLERLGYAERVPVPDDQRARAVRLTPRGHAMVSATRALRAGLEAELSVRVGPRRLATATAVLAELVDVLDLTGDVARRTVPAPD